MSLPNVVHQQAWTPKAVAKNFFDDMKSEALNSNNSYLSRATFAGFALFGYPLKEAESLVHGVIAAPQTAVYEAIASGEHIGRAIMLDEVGADEAVIDEILQSGQAGCTSIAEAANTVLVVEGGVKLTFGRAPAGLTTEETTVLLTEHLDTALVRFSEEGFTQRQLNAMLKRPQLEAAFRGERIDFYFREAVMADSRLGHVQMTPRFKFGPDVFDAANGVWWDVTTMRDLGRHATKYARFGDGIGLLYVP